MHRVFFWVVLVASSGAALAAAETGPGSADSIKNYYTQRIAADHTSIIGNKLATVTISGEFVPISSDPDPDPDYIAKVNRARQRVDDLNSMYCAYDDVNACIAFGQPDEQGLSALYLLSLDDDGAEPSRVPFLTYNNGDYISYVGGGEWLAIDPVEGAFIRFSRSGVNYDWKLGPNDREKELSAIILRADQDHALYFLSSATESFSGKGGVLYFVAKGEPAKKLDFGIDCLPIAASKSLLLCDDLSEKIEDANRYLFSMDEAGNLAILETYKNSGASALNSFAVELDSGLVLSEIMHGSSHLVFYGNDGARIELESRCISDGASIIFSEVNGPYAVVNANSYTTPGSRWFTDFSTLDPTQACFGLNVEHIGGSPSFPEMPEISATLHYTSSSNVPYHLIESDVKGPLSGAVLIQSYVGHRTAQLPGYASPVFLSWLKEGGKIAVAHIRGVQGFGRKWAREGEGVNKLQSLNDYIAVAEELTARPDIDAGRLSLTSGSGGSFIAVSAFYRRPDLFNAAVAHAPCLVIWEGQRGPCNQTNEFGDPTDEKQYAIMTNFSPWHALAESEVQKPLLIIQQDQDPVVPNYMTETFLTAKPDTEAATVLTFSSRYHNAYETLEDRLAADKAKFEFLKKHAVSVGETSR